MPERTKRILITVITLSIFALAAGGLFYFSSYLQKILIMIMIYFAIGMASSYNLIEGFAGYPSFGHVVFVGLGAYTSVILVNTYQVPFPLTILCQRILVLHMGEKLMEGTPEQVRKDPGVIEIYLGT